MQIINDTLDLHATKIEKEKLKALGKKNQLYEEIESKSNKELELKLMIKEKIEELERLKNQYQSLEKIENEQKLIIEKLSNNDESN
jgi:intraflagellar transport protein 20